MEIKFQEISETVLWKGLSRNRSVFATSVATELQVYFSWRQDHLSQGADAFQQSWKKIKAHAFPPFP